MLPERCFMEEKRAVTMDKIVNLCKARGIIFPGSDIYGGMGNTWDYGPVGVEIRTTSSAPGGRNSFRKAKILTAWTPQF